MNVDPIRKATNASEERVEASRVKHKCEKCNMRCATSKERGGRWSVEGWLASEFVAKKLG